MAEENFQPIRLNDKAPSGGIRGALASDEANDGAGLGPHHFLMLDRQRPVVDRHLSIVLSGNWIGGFLGPLLKHASALSKFL